MRIRRVCDGSLSPSDRAAHVVFSSRRRNETGRSGQARKIYFRPGVSPPRCIVGRIPTLGRCIRAHVVGTIPQVRRSPFAAEQFRAGRSIVPEDPIKLFPGSSHDGRLRSTSANVKLIAGRRSPKRRRVSLSSTFPRAVSFNSVCHSRSGMISYFYDSPHSSIFRLPRTFSRRSMRNEGRAMFAETSLPSRWKST